MNYELKLNIMKTYLKNLCKLCLLCVLSAYCTSCGDDDKNVTPSQLSKGNDERPTWTIRQGLYNEMDLTMGVQVTLQDELLPYASEDDLMCATINGEVRALAEWENTGGEIYFSLVIAGNGDSDAISLSYYCSKLKRIYTVANWKPFNSGTSPTDNGKPYIVEFIPTEK